MAVQLVWQTEPIVLSGRIADYGRRVLAGLHQLANLFAARAEALAKQLAPWTDRTGAARQGLRGFAQTSATGAVLYLVHSVFYGRWLETGTRKMGPRPAIQPALESIYGPLMQAIRTLVGA